MIRQDNSRRRNRVSGFRHRLDRQLSFHYDDIDDENGIAELNRRPGNIALG